MQNLVQFAKIIIYLLGFKNSLVDEIVKTISRKFKNGCYTSE